MASSIATDTSEFICLSCKKEYDTPKRLPCNHSICSNCEINGKIYIKCPTCEKTHKIPRSGFPINTSLVQENEKRRLRLDIEKRLRSAMSSLEQVEDDLSNRESIIGEYTDLLINDIDIKVESIINEIHAARDELLSKIKVYKGKCIKNSGDLGHVKRMLERCNKSYDKCLKHLTDFETDLDDEITMTDTEKDEDDITDAENDTKGESNDDEEDITDVENDTEVESSDDENDITDAESDKKVESNNNQAGNNIKIEPKDNRNVISDSKKQQTRFEKSLNEIARLVDDINSCRNEFDSKLFGEQKLVFLESNIKITTNLIGLLSADPWIEKIYENIQTQKSMSVYNYAIVEEEDEYGRNIREFEYTGAFCREIEENKIFLAASRTSVFYDNVHYLDLFIFTPNGKAKKTIRPTCYIPEKSCRYGKLKSKKIVVAYDDTIKIYDYNLRTLNKLKLDDEVNKNVNDAINALFVNEDNEILVYTDTSLRKFDSNLKLIDFKKFQKDCAQRIDYECYLEFKSGKLYSYDEDGIKEFNHETLALMRMIELDSIVEDDRLFQFLNKDRFVFVDKETKEFGFYNFDMKCLFKCRAESVPGITSFSINEETGYIVINDVKTNNVFLLK